MAKNKTVKQTDALDAFKESGTESALMMVLWKVRHVFPEMAVPITEADLDAFRQSIEFTKQKPAVVVYRRPAQEARQGMPATGRRNAVPPMMAMPAGREVTVMIVEAGTEIVDPASGIMLSPGNTIRAVESDERDHEMSTMARQAKQAKTRASQLASELLSNMASGTYSNAMIEEAAQMLSLFSRVG